MSLMSPSSAEVDERARQCQCSTAIVITMLLEFVPNGRIERRPGNQVALP
jgi:predicted Rossmann fold nucleotide-binding protein DprA/Smf involved in DNA uptake